jgi:hypothetical protein
MLAAADAILCRKFIRIRALSRTSLRQLPGLEDYFAESTKPCREEGLLKAEIRSKIKQLALQLYRSGIYPAPKDISKACDGKIGMTTGELTVVLREVRLEVGIKFTEWKG